MAEKSVRGGQQDETCLLRCSGVIISAHSICRLRRGKRVNKIPRERIINLKLCRDTGVRHPFCHFLLGFTLVLFGFIGDFIILISNLKGVRLMPDPEPGSFIIPLVPVGFWVMVGLGLLLLAGVFRSKYHLVVETEGRVVRMFFEKTAGRDEICRFLDEAGKQFGYEIDITGIDNPDME